MLDVWTVWTSMYTFGLLETVRYLPSMPTRRSQEPIPDHIKKPKIDLSNS